MKIKDVINEQKIKNLLEETKGSKKEDVWGVLEKASLKEGLNLNDVALLINADEPELIKEMFKVAGEIKRDIYGERLVLFAPLYVSNYCVNDCDYCAFHCRNKTPRKKLNHNEIREQVKILEDMGHKRLLLEFGEHEGESPIDYVVDAIKTIYDTKSGKGEIRRVNVNIAATSVENYKKLKKAGIGTYQLFQETYHQETYEKMHHGPKADYGRQLFAHDRAMEAGLDDLGLGVLFGLYDWRFDTLALISHGQYLDKKYNVGPHTFSVPRLQPADTVNEKKFKHLVSDDDFLKIIAILRMAVPYTGMIISTRESLEIRKKAFKLGISQTSSASKPSPGGYGKKDELTQFCLQDHRSVDQFIESILEQGLLPSFCTACYRQGRTGETFMDIAKPGEIHNLCRPNAILTFKEYLEDYATSRVSQLGLEILDKYLDQIDDKNLQKETRKRLKRIENRERDLYF